MKRKGNNAPADSEAIKITTLEILRVKEFENYVLFDFQINGVKIYGARVIEGKNGDFIAFPSHKGNDGNYYNHVWFKMNDQVQKYIIEAVENFEN